MSNKIAPTKLTEEIIADARKYLPDDVVEYIDKCMQEEHSESQLITVLHKVQNYFGYIPEDAISAVGQLMNIPTSKISGVTSFYHLFRLTPKGKYVISICTGTACYVKGSDRLLSRLYKELGIKGGETTKDGLFTLNEARCLGTCALAPVLKVNDEIHAHVTPDQIPSILDKYYQE